MTCRKKFSVKKGHMEMEVRMSEVGVAVPGSLLKSLAYSSHLDENIERLPDASIWFEKRIIDFDSIWRG